VSGPHPVDPLLLDYGSHVVRAATVWPLVRGRWPEVLAHWRTHRPHILGVAVLSPVAFIMVLIAMQTTPVSYVAPAREVSILIGVMFGAKLLDEGNTSRRLLASVIMLGGIVMLAVG
jgi:drug/metabolite transporter (DMT)-like permease